MDTLARRLRLKLFRTSVKENFNVEQGGLGVGWGEEGRRGRFISLRGEHTPCECSKVCPLPSDGCHLVLSLASPLDREGEELECRLMVV